MSLTRNITKIPGRVRLEPLDRLAAAAGTSETGTTGQHSSDILHLVAIVSGRFSRHEDSCSLH
jgi:hypothetical protein